MFEITEWHRVQCHYKLDTIGAEAEALIKRCDLIALATERRDLMPYTPMLSDEWPVLDTPGQEIRASEHHSLNLEARTITNWKTWAFQFETEAMQLLELRLMEALG